MKFDFLSRSRTMGCSNWIFEFRFDPFTSHVKMTEIVDASLIKLQWTSWVVLESYKLIDHPSQRNIRYQMFRCPLECVSTPNITVVPSEPDLLNIHTIWWFPENKQSWFEFEPSLVYGNRMADVFRWRLPTNPFVSQHRGGPAAED
jgi:hypothetical protein